MMDMRALKVGQKVTLSGALPKAEAVGIVIEVSKYRVSVQVDARIEGVAGAYCVRFDYDGHDTTFCDWTDSKAGWEWASPCPIPDLKIIGVKEDAALALVTEDLRAGI